VATHAGEVRVNASGEPDRDDFGLPPVEIEIPDDARELDRDVQAYRRELRARRRQVRLGRLHAPLTRDGLVLPLLAGCLAMVLISGVLLTVFTAGQSGTPARSPAPSPRSTHAPASPAASTGAAQAAGRLPDAKVTIGGQPVELSSLMIPSVLALVPSGCQCSAALRQLGRQAADARVSLYLVGVGGDARQVRKLAARAGQPRDGVADDTSRALASAYRPRGLTAVLVTADGAVTAAVRDLGRGSQLTAGQLRSLAPASP
jgi:hypothetical protein